jgi:hypothetical protein
MNDQTSTTAAEPVNLIPPGPEDIFVFGSNLSGIHGAGAAAYASNYRGAVWGVGEGLQGRSYALPTKGLNITHMPITKVKKHVSKFIDFANDHPELSFQVTAVGCGLAGWKNEAIAPLFKNAPINCRFDTAWKLWMPSHTRFWGTYG